MRLIRSIIGRFVSNNGDVTCGMDAAYAILSYHMQIIPCFRPLAACFACKAMPPVQRQLIIGRPFTAQGLRPTVDIDYLGDSRLEALFSI